MAVLITTERLQLRLIEPENDAGPMLALLNSPGFHLYIGDRGVRTVAQAADYIRTNVLASYAQHGFGMWTIERREDMAWIGNAGLVRRAGLPAPDVGYALLPAHERQGYAREAVRAVIRHAQQVLGHEALYAIVDQANLRSASLLLKLQLEDRGLVQLPDRLQWLRLFATSGAAAVSASITAAE
jgi:RimJ/RimL family protein N-acetyltransferase